MSSALLLMGTTGLALADGDDHEPKDPQLPPACTQSGRTVTCTYGFTGETQTFTPPAGVTALTVTLTGASGGAGGDFSDTRAGGGRADVGRPSPAA